MFDSFVADGELVKDDGSHTCIAMNIQCDKKSKACETTDVPVLKLSGGWEILGIFRRQDMPISVWNDRLIISAGPADLCLQREITVDIEKQRIRVVETSPCQPSQSAATYYIQPPRRP